MQLNLANSEFAGWIVFVSVSMMIITAIVHIGFAIGVGRDVHRLHEKKIGTVLVGRVIWTLAALLGGVFTASLYWLVHHSNLASNTNSEERHVFDSFEIS